MSERKLLFLMSQEQAPALAELVEAANRGDGAAACRLGDLYREGAGGLRSSPKEAHRWYARSAMAGNASGQNNLGACYEHGIGCAQSYAKAVKWYRLAAAQRSGTASMNLGYCYLHGHAVQADKIEALRLFREAVARGEPKAQKEIDKLEESNPTPRRKVRIVYESSPTKFFGLVGVAGVPRPEGDRSESQEAANENQDGDPGSEEGKAGTRPAHVD